MRRLAFFTPLGFFSFCYAQKYDITDAVTLNFSSAATASCGGCSINVGVFELDWYQQVYTHVAATVVKFVNNATNVTVTSTIQKDNFTLPQSAAGNAARIVTDSVITTSIGGTLYTLTYPKKYGGIGHIERYSNSPITNGNGTVKCVVSRTALTHDFLIREDVSNGLELSAFIDRDIDRGCQIREASPPEVLVRVSSLTATTTNYVSTPEARTSNAKKASPSIPLSPPTVPRTSSSVRSTRPTILANSPAREATDSSPIATKSTLVEPTPLDSGESASPAATLLSNETPSSSIAPSSPSSTSTQSPQPLFIPSLTSTPSKPQTSQESKLPASFVVNDNTVSQINSSPAPIKSKSPPTQSGLESLIVSRITAHLVVSGSEPSSRSSQSSLPQELTGSVSSEPTAVSIAQTTNFRGGQGVTISDPSVTLGKSGLVVGTNTIPLDPVSASAISHKALGNPSIFSIAGTTLTQGGSGVTISGTRISLGLSDVIIGSSTLKFPESVSPDYLSYTASNPTDFSVASTLFTHGAIITISGTPVSLGSSDIVIGTQTVSFPSSSASIIFSVGGQVFTANPTGLLIGGMSPLSNSLVVTVSGKTVSLGTSGIVIGTKTIALPSESLLPVLTVAGTAFTVNPTGFLGGSETLSPNGAPITISGTPISLDSSDIVIGTRTIDFPAVPSILTVDGQKFTANPSGFSIDDTEIHRGGSPITISGTPISIGSSAVVIGSSTVLFASVTNGLGPAILSGLGITPTPTPTSRAAAGNDSEPFLGAQVKMEASIILLASCVGLAGLIWA